MVRIRYSRIDGMLVSKPIFTGRTNVIVHIFPDTLSYHVIDNETLHVVSEGKGTNLHALKKLVKELVAEMGANFTDELRTSKNALPEN